MASGPLSHGATFKTSIISTQTSYLHSKDKEPTSCFGLWQLSCILVVDLWKMDRRRHALEVRIPASSIRAALPDLVQKEQTDRSVAITDQS